MKILNTLLNDLSWLIFYIELGVSIILTMFFIYLMFIFTKQVFEVFRHKK